MNVGRCRPHMWGFVWGYIAWMSGKQKARPSSHEMLFWTGLNAVLFVVYIKSSSAARLTAARRLLTLSLL
jgi:hypothetical protein